MSPRAARARVDTAGPGCMTSVGGLGSVFKFGRFIFALQAQRAKRAKRLAALLSLDDASASKSILLVSNLLIL
jgi:hypothetical protein